MRAFQVEEHINLQWESAADNAPVDLWVLSARNGASKSFALEVPQGEQPEAEKYAEVLAMMFSKGADEVLMSKVERRYTLQASAIMANEPALVQ